MIEFAAMAEGITPFAWDKAGAPRYVLNGDIVTMNLSRDVFPAGKLCLEGRTIVAVIRKGEVLPDGFHDVPVVETAGTIYPGLVDLHNHLPYNMIPLWKVDRPFKNRLEWQHIDEYYPAVIAPFKLLNEHEEVKYRQSIVRYAECRGLFGGATTGHGLALTNGALYEGLMRNVERPLAAELQGAKSNTADFNPDKLAEMLEWTAEGKPFIYHLSEGIGTYGEDVFRSLQQTPGGLNAQLICIHCVGIPLDGWDGLKAVAGIVWSPTSNLLLYGATCNVEEAKRRGIPIAIGADWAPSGCKNLLGELKVAREVSRHMGGVLSDADLVAGVTSIPAGMVGWSKYLGSIEQGKWADFLILSGSGGDPYARLVEAKESSIRAVVIDGRVRLGEDNGLVIADQLSSEKVVIGGKSYVLDLAEREPNEIGGMKLSDAITNIQYGLAHLPEFEAEQTKTAINGVARGTDDWHIEDEINPEPLASILMKSPKLPAKAMTLEPIAAIDDQAFKKAMRESLNMPDYAKVAFNE